VSTIAILPIKTFSEAKRRLRSDLNAEDRRALVGAMFYDVLVALRRVPRLDGIIIVSGDHTAQQIAAGYGATVVEDDERGHSAAATKGIGTALEAGAERVLLVPGDCPAVDPRELEALLAHPATGRSVLVVPDRHGTGTNALLLKPPDVLAPSFGPDSRRRHVDHASAAGVAAKVVELPSLGLDVDTPDDLAALQQRLDTTHGAAAHTRGMLNQLLRARS
jgi:2-phospho-L-lactate/phosphoenolpyruvate guanylyltransferase